MFDRTFTVKKVDEQSFLYRTYLVQNNAQFYRKKMPNILETKSKTEQQTIEQKAQAIKQSNPFAKLDKNNPTKPFEKKPKEASPLPPSPKTSKQNKSDKFQVDLKAQDKKSKKDKKMKDQREAEFNNLTEQLKMLDELEMSHKMSNKHLNKLKKRMSNQRYENQKTQKPEKAQRVERTDRVERGDRSDKTDRAQRTQRAQKFDRHQKKYQKQYKAQKQPKFEESDNESESEDQTVAESKRFQPYVSEKQILESRKNNENKYYLGTISVSQRNKGFAYIDSDELPGKLVLQGLNINRAFHGATIYFCTVLDYDSSSESETKKEKTTNKIQCRVVRVVKNPAAQAQIIGKLLCKRNKKANYTAFEPHNARLPQFEVCKNPFDGKRHRQATLNKYFIAKIRPWSENEKYPKCDIIDQFGEIGQIEVQCKAILQQYNINESDFTKQTKQFLKIYTDNSSADGEYVIPQEEYQRRFDLRNDLIFTIDPKTARDFDDALSIKELSREEQQKLGLEKTDLKVYEVGIHIADVSYFVPEGSVLDDEAKQRTTSVYLVHRVLPMLPRVLCQTMCSLNPGVERLTVSVWCYVNEQGKVSQKQRFGRSIIQSKARFSYEIVQDIIDSKIKLGEVPQGFGVCKGVDEQTVFEKLKMLNDVARVLRKNRFDAGAITIDTPKKKFELDHRLWPKSYTIEQRNEANFLVEQFMLLANVKVAQILVDNVREATVLRRHPFPGEAKIKKFAQFTKRLGIELQLTKTTKISEQISKVVENPEIKESLRKLAKYEVMFLMEAADYFLVKDSTVDQWFHYALNYNCYTHFTSPIRRYPDILVHRQLIKVAELRNEAIKAINIPALDNILKFCNDRRLAAKRVSTGCQKIFMCLYLKSHEVFTKGVITALAYDFIGITIPEYDIRTTIEFRHLKSFKERRLQEYDKKKFLFISYESRKCNYEFVLREANQISVWLGASRSYPIDYNVKIAFPDLKDPKKLKCLD